MYKIIIAAFLAVSLNGCAQQKCKDLPRYKIVYNKYYGKYAVIIDDSLHTAMLGISFLMKDHGGDYGIYGEQWDENDCYRCVDKSKSLFSDRCKARQFILEYIRKQKDDNWQ